MDIKFYYRGVETFDKKLQERIKKDSSRSWWHDQSDKNDKTFTGYIGKDGFCYDVCNYNSQKRFYERVMEQNQKEKEYLDKFLQTKNTIIFSMDIIQKFIESIIYVTDVKGKIRSIKKKLENGYVVQDFNLRGGKKTRRYKKDNRRFLTDREIIKLKEELGNLDHLESDLSKKIKLEETLERIIGEMYDIKEYMMHQFNNRFQWHETVGLYKDYTEMFENLKIRINHFTFNTIKEKYQIQNKELDISLDDVTIFDETFSKVSEKVEEDKRIQEMMTVKSERTVTKRAKFYIDENGRRVELDESINQVVIHK